MMNILVEKPLNLIKVLEKKTKNLIKYSKKLLRSYNKNIIFLFLEKKRLKIRLKFELSNVFNVFISTISFS